MDGGWQERRDTGRAARQVVPRSAHAEWSPAPGRDAVAVLITQGQTRVEELLPIRYGRMAESPFAFFRGAAAVMARDLSTGKSLHVVARQRGFSPVRAYHRSRSRMLGAIAGGRVVAELGA
jgi:hypothetical protein